MLTRSVKAQSQYIEGMERAVTVGVSSSALLAWYFCLKPTTDRSQKRIAWILTLLSALVSFFGCLPVVWQGALRGWPPETLYGNDPLSRALVDFFVTYLLWDTVFIVVEYPAVGGFLHHGPYLLFMSTALYFDCPGMFVVFMPMELSTIFLAAGYIWPSHRADILFGSTFFLGRLVYHLWVWLRLFETREQSPFFVWPFALLPYIIHIFWFYRWCKSFLRRRRRKDRDTASKAT